MTTLASALLVKCGIISAREVQQLSAFHCSDPGHVSIGRRAGTMSSARRCASTHLHIYSSAMDGNEDRRRAACARQPSAFCIRRSSAERPRLGREADAPPARRRRLQWALIGPTQLRRSNVRLGEIWNLQPTSWKAPLTARLT